MSVKKISLAAALLFALTACSGGGSSTPSAQKPVTPPTNAELHEQIKALQAKADAAEKKLKQAEQNANADKKALEALKAEAKKAREDAEKAKLAAENAKMAADNATKNVDQAVEKALKKAEEDRIKAREARDLHIKKLTKIARDAKIYEAEYLANHFSHLTEQQFTNYLKQREAKYNELKKLALDNGIEENDANHFANNYRDREQDEITDELNRLKEQKIEQEKHNQKIQELIALAKENGLSEWEAQNFADKFTSKELSEAQAELARRKAEIDLENKRNELVQLADKYNQILHSAFGYYNSYDFANAYLDDDIEKVRTKLENYQPLSNLANQYYQILGQDPESFINNNLDANIDEVRSSLEQKWQQRENKRQELINLARNSGLFNGDYEYEAFVNDYLYSDISQAEQELNNRKQERDREHKRLELVALGDKHSTIVQYVLGYYETTAFANEYLDKDINETRKKLESSQKKYDILFALAEEYHACELTECADYHGFVLQNLDKEIEEVRVELKRQAFSKLAESYIDSGIHPDSFANENINLSLEEAKAKLVNLAQKNENIRSQLIQLAKDRGLSEDQATGFGFSGHGYNLEDGENKLDEYIKELAFNEKQKNYELQFLTIEMPVGFYGKVEKREIPLLDSNGFETGKKVIEHYKDVYNQKYSAVVGVYNNTSHQQGYEVRKKTSSDDNYSYLGGFITPEHNLPVEGIATYNGVAFTAERQGVLNYQVNFGTKTGQGSISNLGELDTLTLESGNIGKRYHTSMGIAGDVTSKVMGGEQTGKVGNYALDFYGPKAEEISGTATIDTTPLNKVNYNLPKKYSSSSEIDIGFGGTRGEIQK